MVSSFSVAPSPARLGSGAASAFAAAALFVALLAVLFTAGPAHPVRPYLAVLFHLALLPLVAALPAPPWARAAGYGWVALDVAAGVMTAHGMDALSTTAMRHAAETMALPWLAAASWRTGGVPRAVAVALVPLLAAQALFGPALASVAPGLPFAAMLAAMLSLVTWLVAAGLRLVRSGEAAA